MPRMTLLGRLATCLVAAVGAMVASLRVNAEPPASAPTKIAFLTLGQPGTDVVGPYINAQAMLAALHKIPADQKPQVIVLHIHSQGGMLAEVPRLSDAIEKELKPHARVVAWVDQAISAAALTALSCNEIVMTSEGSIGNAVAHVKRWGQEVPLMGDELQTALEVGEEVAKRGNRDVKILRAMQASEPLSCTLSAAGPVEWRADENGPEVVNHAGSPLTLDAENAKKFGVSIGTADNKQDVVKLLGITSWTEVGQQAEEDLGLYRRQIHAMETRVIELRKAKEDAVQRVRNPKSPEERMEAMKIAGRADGDVGVIFREYPQLREYFINTPEVELGPRPGVGPVVKPPQ